MGRSLCGCRRDAHGCPSCTPERRDNALQGGQGQILRVDFLCLLSAQEARFLYQTRKLERAQKPQLC